MQAISDPQNTPRPGLNWVGPTVPGRRGEVGVGKESLISRGGGRVHPRGSRFDRGAFPRGTPLAHTSDFWSMWVMRPIATKLVKVGWIWRRRADGEWWNRREYEVRVRVWGTARELRAYRGRCADSERGNDHSDVIAFWGETESRFFVGKDGVKRRTPYLGELNFHLEQVDGETVGHEVFHAVMGLARRVRTTPAQGFRSKSREREEDFAIFFSNLYRGVEGVVGKAKLKMAKVR